jgi:integrase/recombinase XerC
MESVRIRRHVNQPRDHAFFAILANTGLRPSEVLALTRADVHLGASPPWIRVKRMKKGAIDELCVPEGVVVPLRTYLQTAPAGLLFPFHRRMAQRKFVFYARHAGVDGHRLYDLRHTAATRLHRLTKDIGLVQRLLGHANPDTTAIYIHIGRAQQKEAVERMGAVT